MRKDSDNVGPSKPWSLLVYIAGDNNLSDYGLSDIIEMCEVGASTNTHVGVEIDTHGEYDGSVRYDITEPDWTGKAHRVVIQRLPELDSGNPASLRAFLKWGITRYSANKRLVVVWNHGAGFRAVNRDIAYDDSGSSLDMPDLTWAFQEVGFDSQNKISLLGFDACLMCMLEIAHHVSSHVEYLVGSQALEPGEGWPYDQVLSVANDDPSVAELAARIVDVYMERCKQLRRTNVTQSAIDLSKTKAAMAALHDYGAALLATTSFRETITSVRLQAQSYSMPDYVDVVHLGMLSNAQIDNESVRAAAQTLVERVSDAVIRSDNWGSQVEHSHGLSIWFPLYKSEYLYNRTKYLSLRGLSDDKAWVKCLDTFHGLL